MCVGVGVGGLFLCVFAEVSGKFPQSINTAVWNGVCVWGRACACMCVTRRGNYRIVRRKARAVRSLLLGRRQEGMWGRGGGGGAV